MSDFDGESSLMQELKASKASVHIEDEVCLQNDARATSSRLQHSPKPYSRLKVSVSPPLSGSESREPECAGVTPSSTNKYFSTPVSSEGEAKKLSVVMEMDTESTAAQGDAGQACAMDRTHRSPQDGDAALGGSPPKMSPYRSCFALERQRMVNQIIGSENECQSPGKRKAVVVDVSNINAEPPPYDSTPFESLLAWEVSQMLKSHMNNDTLLPSESPLDLERTNMQLQGFSSSDFGNKNGKGRSVNDSSVEGVSLGDQACGEFCLKRQTFALPSYKADRLHCESTKTSSDNCKAASGTGTSPHERITLARLDATSSSTSGELKYDVADTSHDGIAPHCPAQEDASKPCVSVTQEIESAPLKFQLLNTVEVIEPSQTVCAIAQEIALPLCLVTKANATIDIKSVSQTSNVTQHTMCSLGEIADAARNTGVLEEEAPLSVAAEQGMVASLNAGESLANTNQVMVLQTVNTTQAMVSNHEGCIPSTTQVIPEPSPVTTGAIRSVHESSRSVNATQDRPAPDDSGNGTQDIMTQDEGKDKETGNATVNGTSAEASGPSTSMGCVIEPPHKDPTEDCMTVQPKLVAPPRGDEGHKPQNKGVPRLLTSAQGTALHSQMSGLPTARRALALFHNPTGQVKELMLSKTPLKGIPGRGGNRPPLAQPSLPRPRVGNTKQNIEGKVGVMAPSKIVGSSRKKVATAKPRSAALPSKFPSTPTHTPSKICTPSSRRLAATQNITAYVKDAAPGISTAPSTRMKSFLTKPGSSPLQPPLPPSLLKSFIKPKSNFPGLPGRMRRYSWRLAVPVKEGPPGKATKRPVASTPAAPIRGSISKDTSESCGNLEACKCCRDWHMKFFKLLEEMECNKLGPEHHGNASR